MNWFQTGFMGAFLQELQQRQTGGLDSWASFFSCYDPRIAARVFSDWVQELPLQRLVGDRQLEVQARELYYRCPPVCRFNHVKAKILDVREIYFAWLKCLLLGLEL